MPRGLNRSGDFSQGNPVTLPKIFGTEVTLPHIFGNQVGIAITNRRVIVSDGTYNSTPGVTATASGDYLVVYNKGTNHVTTTSRVVRRSIDGGVTWGPETTVWTPISPDPTLWQTPGGDLFIEFGKTQSSSGLSGAAYARSVDNGGTWGPFSWFDSPVNATNFVTNFWNDGSLIYGVGYQPHTPVDGTSDTNFWVTLDDGLTWIKRSVVRQVGDASINESAVAKVGPSRLFVVSRDGIGTKTYGHFSDDLGATWGSQIDYTSQVGVLHDPNLIQVGPSLLLVGRDPSVNQLVAYGSTDGGITFSDRTVLDTYTGLNIDGGYSAMILQEDGTVFIVYYADSNGLRLPDIKSLVLHWKD